MAKIINTLFGVQLNETAVTIVIIVITCVIYTYSLLHGFKGISVLANACIYLFFGLLIYVLLFGGQTKYIVETGFSALGRMIQNFFSKEWVEHRKLVQAFEKVVGAFYIFFLL